MQKIANGIYTHRGNWILKNKDGWIVDNCLHIFKTLNDAREYINQILDGTNKREPRIVREWTIAEDYNTQEATDNGNN